MKILKRLILYILNLAIISIVLVILTIFFADKVQSHFINKLNAESYSTYDQGLCKGDVYKTQITNKILSNDDVNGNEVIGYIAFPRIGKWGSISQGDLADGQLNAMNYGVAHDPNTVMPGEKGNTVIAGHRNLLFSNFQKLKVGDLVAINVNNNVYLYTITDYEIVDPLNDTAHATDVIFNDDGTEKLTLYTCYPFERWKYYDHRIVLHAKPVTEFELPCAGGING